MRAPVGDHAAAEFAVGAPHGEMFVDAARAQDRVVGTHRGRPEPHVPIEAGFGGLFRKVAGLARTADADVDPLDLADDAVADQLAGDAEFLRRPLHRAGLEDAFVRPDGLHHLARLDDRLAQRLLAVDVFARLGRGDGDVGVPMVGRGDDDGVDVFPGKQLAEVVVGVAALERRVVLLGVEVVDALLGVIAASAVDVAHGDDLRLRFAEEPAHQPARLDADADEAERDAAVRLRRRRPNAGRQDERGAGRSGGLEEGTTIETCERLHGMPVVSPLKAGGQRGIRGQIRPRLRNSRLSGTRTIHFVRPFRLRTRRWSCPAHGSCRLPLLD